MLFDTANNLTESNYRSCGDGRCAFLQDPEKQLTFDVCATPFSCSPAFYKVDTHLGDFCFDKVGKEDTVDNILNQINFI